MSKNISWKKIMCKNNSWQIWTRGFFRKPQKKLLTLHADSHHCAGTKQATVLSMYHTAESVSSNEENIVHSCGMVDKLLLNNGYTSKVIKNIKEKGKKRKNCKKKRDGLRNQQGTYSVLKLPYINDVTSRKFKQAIKSSGLPVRLIETPGQNLRGLLTDSRPLDNEKCDRRNFRTCVSMSKGGCRTRNAIYEINCKVKGCVDNYGGETYRPVSHRFDEHYLNAAKHSAKSYFNIAKHYAKCLTNMTPELEIKIIDIDWPEKFGKQKN